MTHKLEFVGCNLCGKDDSALFFIENEYHVVKCKNCGLVYVNPRPENNLDMDHDIHSENHLKYIQNYTINKEGMYLKAQRILSEIETIKKEKGRLLEVGCATGFFLNKAQEKGWETAGIEPAKPYAQYGVEEYGLKIENVLIEKAKLSDKFFDVVVAINVLSHIRNPTGFFIMVNRILKDDGLFVFETGNKGEMETKKKGEVWSEAWDTPEHLYHFSEQTLNRLAKKTGFKILKIVKKHVVDQALLDENLIVRRDSRAKWYAKQIIRKNYIIRSILKSLLRYYYINISKSDVSSLLLFTQKRCA